MPTPLAAALLRARGVGFALALAAAGAPGPARAHAMLTAATPPAGATLPVAPARVSLTFTEAVEPAFSRIEVDDAQGRRVDNGKAYSAADHREVLMVDLPPLPPGDYTVSWRAVSADTHRTQGNYRFTVGR